MDSNDIESATLAPIKKLHPAMQMELPKERAIAVGDNYVILGFILEKEL